MAAPFYNAIKGTTAGTPGTGAFTPNAASTGFLAWSTVASGWIGLVRFEDGSAWELTYCYWNATTLSRASTQVVSSSTGSQLTLTSAATAAMVADASDVQPHLGTTSWRLWNAIPGTAAPGALGIAAPTTVGTGGGVTPATTNFLTEQCRSQYTSATTANGQAGPRTTTQAALYSTTAGRGGFEFVVRFGATQLPTGPRLFVGLPSTTYAASTAEPSAFVAHFAALTLDSTDTNLQFTTNDNSGSGTKSDTGIPLVANGFYEVTISAPPGGGSITCLLIRIDTGAIWYGSRSSDLPATGNFQFLDILGGLNGTNTGTAFVMQFCSMILRSGG